MTEALPLRSLDTRRRGPLSALCKRGETTFGVRVDGSPIKALSR